MKYIGNYPILDIPSNKLIRFRDTHESGRKILSVWQSTMHLTSLPVTGFQVQYLREPKVPSSMRSQPHTPHTHKSIQPSCRSLIIYFLIYPNTFESCECVKIVHFDYVCVYWTIDRVGTHKWHEQIVSPHGQIWSARGLVGQKTHSSMEKLANVWPTHTSWFES